MTANRADVIDRSVENTQIRLGELAEEMGSDDRHYSYRVLRAFLHALRDHLPVDEAASRVAQLPILIRGSFHEGLDPAGAAEHARSLDRFQTGIANEAAWPGRPRHRPQPPSQTESSPVTSWLARQAACCMSSPAICEVCSHRRRCSTMDRGDVSDVSGPRP